MYTNYLQVSDFLIINTGGGNVTAVKHFPPNAVEAHTEIFSVDGKIYELKGEPEVAAWRYFKSQSTLSSAN